MNDATRDSHFNVNVRMSGGSKAKMANNEDPFLRAMEIQERKREKKELQRLEEEKIAAAQAPAPENVEPAVIPDEVPAVQDEGEVAIDPTPAPEAAESPTDVPVKPPAPVKPAGGGVPGPTPRNDFTTEEKAAMLKRAKAHAAEVRARKNK